MLKCFKCDRSLTNAFMDGIQPIEGTAFLTHGHYGSTYFDPMDGSKIEIVICDKCLIENEDKIYK